MSATKGAVALLIGVWICLTGLCIATALQVGAI